MEYKIAIEELLRRVVTVEAVPKTEHTHPLRTA